MNAIRALIWLRWRILINSLEGRAGRDRLDRLSGAADQLAPVLAVLVIVPSAIALAAVGAHAGWMLAQAEPRGEAFERVRLLLFAGAIVAAAGPLLLPAGARSNSMRLMLLPIPRGVLYAGVAAAALAEPWIVLTAATLVAVPAGLLAGGAVLTGAVAGAAGALLLGTLAGLSAALTFLAQLTFRSRWRGELVALCLFLAVSLAALIPVVRDINPRGGDRVQRAQPRTHAAPIVARHAAALVPSEHYAAAVRAVSSGTSAFAPLALLTLSLMAVHTAAAAAFVRTLQSPAISSAPFGSLRMPSRSWHLPFVRPETSAVALTQLKLAFRTPRGRLGLFSPPLFVLLPAGWIAARGSGLEIGPIRLETGPALAAFGSFLALLSSLPIAMNQFAIDGPGLTLSALAPLDPRALLRGKALGNALTAAVPAALCLAAAMVLVPGGSGMLWVCVPLAFIATCSLLAPAACLLSATFPRAVDLKSIGSASNAHGLASAAGTLIVLAGSAASLLTVLAALRIFERPALAPVLVAGLALICAGAARMLFGPARAVFLRRREALVELSHRSRT